MDEENKTVVTEDHPELPKEKEGVVSKVLRSFIRTIDFDQMGDELMEKVVEPNLKTLVWKIIASIAQGVLFQKPITDDVGPVPYNKVETYGGRANYNKMYQTTQESSGKTIDVSSRGMRSEFSGPLKFRFEDEMRGEKVLADARKAFRAYGKVKVADMYDFCELYYDNPMLNKYGWRDIEEFWLHWDALAGKWILECPRPKVL